MPSAAVASGCVVSAAVAMLMLPSLPQLFDAHPIVVHWMDAAVALGSLGVGTYSVTICIKGRQVGAATFTIN